MSSLRVVTLNMWGDRAPLAERLAVAAQEIALLSPDAVLLQEVREHRELPNTARTLAGLLGDWHATYAGATYGPPGTWGPGSLAGEEGLAILLREPPARTATLELPDARPNERRMLLSAQMAGVGPERWVHTAHLHWRPKDDDARARQAQAIWTRVGELGPGAVHIVGGDFNNEPESPAVQFLTGQLELHGHRGDFTDLWSALHGAAPGITWSKRNPGTEPLAWLGVERRIDFLLVADRREANAARPVECRVIAETPQNGVFASDHFGVFGAISL